MRLDTLLMQAGLVPRKYARQFCRNWEVTAHHDDGRVDKLHTGATKVDPARVRIDGEPVPYAGVPLHVVMHKPAGYVCTHADDEGETVYDLLPRTFQLRKPVLSTVGRLDKAATGLLLLTQSGPLAARLTSPLHGCSKEYIVSLSRPLSEEGWEAAAFAAGGIQLADGAATRPAMLTRHTTLPHVCKVTLWEGRYHQLRRMFAAVGHEVTAIHRIAFGTLRLTSTGLGPGEWRLLTAEEIDALLSDAPLPSDATAAGGGRCGPASTWPSQSPPAPIPLAAAPTCHMLGPVQRGSSEEAGGREEVGLGGRGQDGRVGSSRQRRSPPLR